MHADSSKLAVRPVNVHWIFVMQRNFVQCQTQVLRIADARCASYIYIQATYFTFTKDAEGLWAMTVPLIYPLLDSVERATALFRQQRTVLTSA